MRVRDQIVADGFSEPLDWQKSGREMPPLEWHRELDNPQVRVWSAWKWFDFGGNLGEPTTSSFPSLWCWTAATAMRATWAYFKVPSRSTPRFSARAGTPLRKRSNMCRRCRFFATVLKSHFRTSRAVAHTPAPQDAPLMTYCTGGIRCVKINAYLEQTLGFTNVSRLQGGIISYTRELERLEKQQASAEGNDNGDSDVEMVAGPAATTAASTAADDTATNENVHLTRHVGASKFKGVNYVFDERMGARITADVLSLCETCGVACDLFTNCASYHCHVRFIQCEACRGPGAYGGCCSKACQGAHGAALQVEAEAAVAQAARAGRKAVPNRAMLARRCGVCPPRNASPPHVPAAAPPHARVFRPASPAAAAAPVAAAAVVAMNAMPNRAETEAGAEASSAPERRDHASALDAQVRPRADSTASWYCIAHPLTHIHPTHCAIFPQVAALSAYCERHSAPEPPLLRALRDETKAVYKQVRWPAPPPAWVNPSTHTSRIINSLRPCPHVQVDLPEHIYHWGFPSRPANPRWYSFFPGGAHGLRPTAGAHPGAPRRGQRRPARPGARLVHRLRDAVPR